MSEAPPTGPAARAGIDPARGVWLRGAGRTTRRRFAGLEAGGIWLAGFIDVDVKRQGQIIDGRVVLPPRELPTPRRAFVIGGVGVRGARDLIRASLEARGFRLGEGFVLAA